MSDPTSKLPERPPFDHGKHTFWLVAFVIAWLLLISTAFLGACVWQPNPTCATGKFAEILQTILASALAFAAGRTSK